MDVFDYIVVGGGSAGCTVTHRLVKAGKSVLMIEAGPNDDNQFVHMPGGFVRLFATERVQFYLSEPQAAADGRPIAVPQGRTLGGGSSVNAMIYIRGAAADYDEWRDMGNPGWGWDDVLPVFKRAESNQRLAGPLHGTEGPLPVSDARFRHPLSLAGLRAAQEAGYPYNDDFNGASQQGVGFYQVTQRDGERGSAASTYLRAVRGNKRLKVITDAFVGKLITENGAAVGVTITDKSGAATEARAREEVILAAGDPGDAKDPPFVRHRPGPRPSCVQPSRWCATCPASAPISRTISMCRSMCGSRIRSVSWAKTRDSKPRATSCSTNCSAPGF